MHVPSKLVVALLIGCLSSVQGAGKDCISTEDKYLHNVLTEGFLNTEKHFTVSLKTFECVRQYIIEKMK